MATDGRHTEFRTALELRSDGSGECARAECDEPAACMTPAGPLCDEHADDLARRWDE